MWIRAFIIRIISYNIKSGKFYHYKTDQKLSTYSLENYKNLVDNPNNNEFYGKKNFKLITEEGLDKILKETQKYLISNIFLKETFHQNLNRRRDYENFGLDEKYRWFCVFFDVEEYLKRLNDILLGKRDNDIFEKIKKLSEDFEKQAKEKKKDWKIKYQEDDVESMYDYIE